MLEDWTKAMNIRAAKDETSFLFPTNISYAGSVASDSVAAPQRDDAGALTRLLRGAVRGLAWIAELPRRHAVLSELELMSDRELADIGLARGELSKVFEPAYVASRAR